MAPVIIDGAVLFRVRGVTSFPAEVRARLIQERILEAARDPAVAPDSIRVVPGEGGAANRGRGSDDHGRPRRRRGRSKGCRPPCWPPPHAIRLRQAIADYRTARLAPALWRRRARERSAPRRCWRPPCSRSRGSGAGSTRILRRRVQARIHSVGIQSFEVMRADRIRSALESLFFGARTIVYVAVVLVYLGYRPRPVAVDSRSLAAASSGCCSIRSWRSGARSSPTSQASGSSRCSSCSIRVLAANRPAVLRSGRERRGHTGELRRGMGAADLQDRPRRHRRARP